MIKDIAKILDPSEGKTSLNVSEELSSYLEQTKDRLTSEEDSKFIAGLMSYSKGFWKGLFTFYDHPILPRTNNNLELFFRKIKQRYRRITGSRTWNRYIMRHGEYIVFAENSLDDADVIKRLNSTPYEAYAKEVESWNDRKKEHKKRFRFKKNPAQFLKEIEDRWLNQ